MTDEARALTEAEAVLLAEHEAIIASGLGTFYAVGTSLLAIRDAGLYRKTHKTFEGYCRDRWGMARSTAYQLMDASAVFENVRHGGQIPPANERQARPLASLAPEMRSAVWDFAVKTAGPEGITAAHVARVAERARFVCMECGELFSEEVWHCPVCDHHWPMGRTDCWNCHEYDRETDAPPSMSEPLNAANVRALPEPETVADPFADHPEVLAARRVKNARRALEAVANNLTYYTPEQMVDAVAMQDRDIVSDDLDRLAQWIADYRRLLARRRAGLSVVH